jgi:hypothetical protein
VSPSPKAAEVKKILAAQKSINYRSFYGKDNAIIPSSPANSNTKDLFATSTMDGFNKTNGGGNMDAWKLMVRDDVLRFENEQIEKKVQKK